LSLFDPSAMLTSDFGGQEYALDSLIYKRLGLLVQLNIHSVIYGNNFGDKSIDSILTNFDIIMKTKQFFGD
jgi:hypothetical protein